MWSTLRPYSGSASMLRMPLRQWREWKKSGLHNVSDSYCLAGPEWQRADLLKVVVIGFREPGEIGEERRSLFIGHDGELAVK